MDQSFPGTGPEIPDRPECMKKATSQQALRLRKIHGAGNRRDITAEDGARLVQAQSLRNGIVAGLIAIVLFSVLWIALSALLNRIFPWLTVLLGAMVGFGVRQAGRGVDWRFPVAAAVLALLGAFLANVVVAASTTADILETSTLHVLKSVTTMTWPVFFDEVWNVADGFYAVLSAGLAAFLSNRQLTRSEYYALRLWRAKSDGHH